MRITKTIVEMMSIQMRAPRAHEVFGEGGCVRDAVWDPGAIHCLILYLIWSTMPKILAPAEEMEFVKYKVFMLTKRKGENGGRIICKNSKRLLVQLDWSFPALFFFIQDSHYS